MFNGGYTIHPSLDYCFLKNFKFFTKNIYQLALTHMRWKNDEVLANRTNNIDLVLGGMNKLNVFLICIFF